VFQKDYSENSILKISFQKSYYEKISESLF